jgi:hypothetical protein
VPVLLSDPQVAAVPVRDNSEPLIGLETGGSLPPMTDGMHRLQAASLEGQESIEVELFDGNTADAIPLSAAANVTHGLPLSGVGRRAAAARIMALHPQMSDRAIAESAGLTAKTVAAIRRRSNGAAPRLTVRVGRDGRVRPLDAAPGRQRAAELLISSPEASLREVARAAGISPGTVSDVRRRLQRGEQPAPARSGVGSPGDNAAGARRSSRPTRRPAAPPAPAAILEKLLRDPSLRHNEMGRWLLRLLQANVSGTQELPAVAAAVPPHCVALIAQLARHYEQMWHAFADELRERMLDIEAHEGAPAI